MAYAINDIWVTLTRDKETLVFIILWIGWGTIIIFSILKSIRRNDLTFLESASLALGGWVLPILIVSILTLALGALYGVLVNPPLLLILMFLSAGIAIYTTCGHKEKSTADFLLPLFVGGTLLLSVLLRLPFITRTLLPPYFDSAEHYRIINILIKDYTNTNLTNHFVWPVTSYYHLGYHIILAILETTSSLKLDRVILVFGQIVLAFVAFPLFFIVRHETKSDLAGWFAVILGIFGWYMPAHAVNWGKYPALLSLLGVQFTLGLLFLINENHEGMLKNRMLMGLVILSICATLLIHTRSIIIIGFAVIAWILAQGWEQQAKIGRMLLLGFVLIGLAVEIIYIERNTVLNPLFDPYLHKGIWVTGVIGILSIFAYPRYRRFVITCLLFMLLLILSLFIPIPSNTFLTLMDRPMIEMVLFIPLSILGGLGYASLNGSSFLQLKPLKAIVAVFLSGLIVFHAFSHYSFYPSDCCAIVGNDDVVALDWMDKNLPRDARILISSSEIKIAPSGESPQNSGSDAGVWITILIDRSTISSPYRVDFGKTYILKKICDQGITHIYVGSTGQSFNTDFLEQKQDWYKILLVMPNVKVYQVIGCET